MRYLQLPIRRIIAVSLVLILCLTMYAQHGFWGWADSYGTSGLGNSLGESDDDGYNLFDALKLHFELPDGRFPMGMPFDPLDGVRVLNGRNEDMTDVVDLQAFDISETPVNKESPAVGTYTFLLTATHPETEKEYTANYPVEIYNPRAPMAAPLSSDAYVRLSEGTTINVGGYSYINMTANLATGIVKTGRYIVIQAPKGEGFTFNLSDIAKISDVSDIELRDDGQTLLISLNEESESIITMDFPVFHEITEERSKALTDSTAYTFEAYLYVGQTGDPVGSGDYVDDDIRVINLTNYPESTMFVPIVTKSKDGSTVEEEDINNYDTAIVRDGTPYIDQFSITIHKSTAMRSSYDLELIVPVHADLVPVASSNVTIGEYKGEPAFILKAEDYAGAKALLGNLLNPADTNTATYTNKSFSFMPAFSNYTSLQNKVYEATNPVTLRVHQYGGTYDHELEWKYLLDNTSYIPGTLYYDVTPKAYLRGDTDMPMNFLPYYEEKRERSYEDLDATFTFNWWTQPQNIKNLGLYGDITVTYTYGDTATSGSNTGGGINGVTSASKTLGENEIYDFVIPSGKRVYEIRVQGKIDTSQQSKRVHFVVNCDIPMNPYTGTNNAISLSATPKYYIKSVNYTAGYKEGTINNVVAILDEYRLAYAKFSIEPRQSLNSSSAPRNYYLDNRPSGDQPVAYLHYKYDYLVNPVPFTWTINTQTSSEDFIKSLSSITATPGASGATSAQYLESFTVTYTTAQGGGGSDTFSGTDTKGKEYKFAFKNDSDYITSLVVTYTTAQWKWYSVSNNNTISLFSLNMDLNKSKSSMGQDLPSIQGSTRTLTVNSTVEGEKGAGTVSSLAANGTAGNFIRDREPSLISGDYLQTTLNKTSIQGGANVEVSLSQIIASVKEPSSGKVNINGEKMELQNVTTYIPINKNFFYIDGSHQVSVNNPYSYDASSLEISSVNFIPAANGADTSWLVVNWSKFTTGYYVNDSGTYGYKNDPKLTFTLKASPLAENGDQIILNDKVYSDVQAAIDANPYYAISIIGANGKGTHDFGSGSQSFTNMTVGDPKTSVRILAAATYGIQIFGGIDGVIYNDDIISYYDHQDIQGVVKMNYETVESGGKEDGVVYVPIPGATGSHKGLKLAGAVDISQLPSGSSVAYSSESNPSTAMLSNWDASETEYTANPGNWSSVTMVRIIGMNLDQNVTLAYIPLTKAGPKEDVGDQRIDLKAHVQYHQNLLAEKSETVMWSLTDYKLSGFFFEDSPVQDGSMTGKTKLPGQISVQKQGAANPYPIVEVTASAGYTALMPTYGTYEVTALSAGYTASGVMGDNRFDSNGKLTLSLTSGFTATAHAGFVRDNSQRVVVAFLTNGGAPVPNPQVQYVGDLITQPADPTKPDAEFGGWYEGNPDGSKKNGVSQWDFATDRIANSYAGSVIYLVADWIVDEPMSITVSDIDFGTNSIPFEDTLYRRVAPTETMSVVVRNVPAGTWALQVKCTTPFTMVDGGTTYTIPETTLRYYAQGSSSFNTLESTVTVYSGSDSSKEFEWTNGYGILANIGPDDLEKDGDYQAVLTWTVYRGPLG